MNMKKNEVYIVYLFESNIQEINICSNLPECTFHRQSDRVGQSPVQRAGYIRRTWKDCLYLPRFVSLYFQIQNPD